MLFAKTLNQHYAPLVDNPHVGTYEYKVKHPTEVISPRLITGS